MASHARLGWAFQQIGSHRHGYCARRPTVPSSSRHGVPRNETEGAKQRRRATNGSGHRRSTRRLPTTVRQSATEKGDETFALGSELFQAGRSRASSGDGGGVVGCGGGAPRQARPDERGHRRRRRAAASAKAQHGRLEFPLPGAQILADGYLPRCYCHVGPFSGPPHDMSCYRDFGWFPTASF